jgi:hypothetical protein
MDTLITEIANKIVNETIFMNWKFYGLLILITFLTTCISSFVFPYLKTRGNALATKADFQSLLTQLQKTTETTETIKTAITHEDWALKEFKLLKRNKLEDLLYALFEVEDWISKCTVQQVYGELKIEKPQAFNKARLISQLYFTELGNEMSSFNNAFHNINILVLTAQKYALVYKHDSEAITKALEKPVNPIVLQSLQDRMTNLHKENIEEMKRFSDDYIKEYKVFDFSVRKVEEKARELMSLIINVVI